MAKYVIFSLLMLLCNERDKTDYYVDLFPSPENINYGQCQLDKTGKGKAISIVAWGSMKYHIAN